MPPTIQYATMVDHVSITCCTLGHGAPLVVMPAGPWSTIQLEWTIVPWRDWYTHLAQHRQIIRYDLRGTGLSEHGPLDFTLDAQVHDLQAVVDHLRLEQVAVLALQTAGPAAISYAARQPDRVAQLVLWDTYVCGEDYYGSTPSQALHAMRDKDWSLFTEAITHERFGWGAGETARQMAGLVREHLTPQLIEAYVAAARAIDVTALLSLVRAPTLVLQHQQVPYPDVRVAGQLAAGIPAARLVVMEGASIAPWTGDVEGLLKVIDAFLGPGQVAPRGRGPSSQPPQQLPERLSERELAVLHLIDAGLSNQEIAQHLVIALATVKTHINSPDSKLDARSRTQALARGREHKLL